MDCDFTFTVSAVVGQFEASGAAALVGPLCVLTLVGAESSGIMPALIDIYRTRGTGYEMTRDPDKNISVLMCTGYYDRNKKTSMDVPSHSLVILLKMKPILHSQRYKPTRLKQPWSPHTLPARHSSTSVTRRGEMRSL